MEFKEYLESSQERECSRIAIEMLTGVSVPNIARTNTETIFAIEDLGFKRDLSPTKEWRGKTIRDFNGMTSISGIVGVAGHVMPVIDGKLSNHAGWSNEPITYIASFSKK